MTEHAFNKIAEGAAEAVEIAKGERAPADRHWMDCAVHGFPDGEPGPCDCGGLDLTSYRPERFSPAFIPVTGRFGFFVDLGGPAGFVEEHDLPTRTLVAIATASNLPNAHRWMAGGIDADRVNLNDTRVAVIEDLKAFAIAQSRAGHVS